MSSFAADLDESAIRTLAQNDYCHKNLLQIIARACLESDRALLTAVLEFYGEDSVHVAQLSSDEIRRQRIKIRNALDSASSSIKKHYKEPQTVKNLPRIMEIFFEEKYNVDAHVDDVNIMGKFMDISYFSDEIRKKMLNLVLESEIKDLKIRENIY